MKPSVSFVVLVIFGATLVASTRLLSDMVAGDEQVESIKPAELDDGTTFRPQDESVPVVEPQLLIRYQPIVRADDDTQLNLHWYAGFGDCRLRVDIQVNGVDVRAKDPMTLPCAGNVDKTITLTPLTAGLRKVVVDTTFYDDADSTGLSKGTTLDLKVIPVSVFGLSEGGWKTLQSVSAIGAAASAIALVVQLISARRLKRAA